MKIILSVAALLGMAAGLAIAQQPYVPPHLLPENLRSDNIVTLTGVEAVQKDLDVNKVVAHKLTLLNNDYQAAMEKEREKAGIARPGPGKTSDEDREKMVEYRSRLNNEFIPKATELLSADQVKRIQQIQLQARLISGPTALLSPAVAAELKLTDDQKETLTALSKEMREKQYPGGGATGKAAIEAIPKVALEYAGKAVEALTAEQKEQLNKMRGKEFDIHRLPRGIVRR